MARNRKTGSTAQWFGAAVKAVLLCLAIGTACLGYVWQKTVLVELGQDILKRERKLADLQLKNEELRKQLSFLSSAENLKARNRMFGLIPPPPGQVIRLPEPVVVPGSVPEVDRQYGVPAAVATVPAP
ncbi:MAG: hypothetical protein WCR20_21870 [Verrucomicrobiota bacterium]|jgi:hypothetical protein|nr:hypothetical protein [Verrucomicrobiota bacterium]